MLVFAAASAACGLAPTTDDSDRRARGAGHRRRADVSAGARHHPVNFAGNERAKALGIFGSVIGIAAVAGQILGGTFWRSICGTSNGGRSSWSTCRWRWRRSSPRIFILPKDEQHDAVGLDWGGVALITTALLLLIVPLLEGRELGWPLWMIACFVAAFPLFGLFVWYERRFAARGGRALVRMELFAYKSFAFGVPIAALFMASYAGFLFTLALYLQVGLGFSPLQSGMTYTPTAIGFFITSLAAPRLIPLLGRQVLTLGYIISRFRARRRRRRPCSAAGARLHGFELAPSLFIVGLGNGLGLSPLVGTVIAGLAPQEAGAGAGVVTTTLQVGNALGVAIIGLLFFVLLGTAAPGALTPMLSP